MSAILPAVLLAILLIEYIARNLVAFYILLTAFLAILMNRNIAGNLIRYINGNIVEYATIIQSMLLIDQLYGWKYSQLIFVKGRENLKLDHTSLLICEHK